MKLGWVHLGGSGRGEGDRYDRIPMYSCIKFSRNIGGKWNEKKI